MRKVPFVEDQYYHIYNRGTDKRNIVEDNFDIQRFFQSILEFNVPEPIGSIYEKSFRKKSSLSAPSTKSIIDESKLVEIIAYSINTNHYHFILRPLVKGGIEKFMQKLGAGYTRYFNEKYDRTGALFQGRFKSSHIKSNERLLYMSVYTNLNHRVHRLSAWSTKSSWNEYMGLNDEKFCKKDIILGQFDSVEAYKNFAEDTIDGIVDMREKDSEMKKDFLE